MEASVTFGEWLRQSRDELRLTREEFAARVGCSVSALRKIENGERRPSAQVAELIANCLGIPAAERPTFVKVARGVLDVDRLPPHSSFVSSREASPASLPTTRSHLPVIPTPFIGRQTEVEQLGQLLRGSCRLLTLTGPGGIGKTRLAIETAAGVREAFPDGVYFVPLSSISSARFLVPLIADSVGFTFHHANRADSKTQLFDFLSEKQVLLVIDNVEPFLAEPGIRVLAELLMSSATIKLLVTSREPLEFQGEWVFELDGLPIPDEMAAEAGGRGTSVELFLQRARRAYVRFNATDDDYPAILRICHLMGGNPLGVELAAGWVRTLSCDEIAGEIERGMDFLSVSAQDVPVRHRSMRAVFDHSWQLLGQEEQVVLARLSIFHGGFRREAAEAIAGTTLAMLSTLVTKSLLRRSGTGRFDLHQLIRQFAAEHLAERPEEHMVTLAKHGTYYLASFGQADARLRSNEQLDMLAKLTAEMANFRAAWDWAIAQGKFELIERTMRTFWMLFDTRGWFQEGLDFLGRAVSALEDVSGQFSERTYQVAMGHLLACRAWLAYRLANYEQAQAMLERSLKIILPWNEEEVLVEIHSYLGMLMEVTGDYDKAMEHYAVGLELATSRADRYYRALCLTLLNGPAAITHGRVDPNQAYAGLREASMECRSIGDPRLTAFSLRILSQGAFSIGRFDEAFAASLEGIELNTAIGDRWGLGSSYRGLGLIEQARGQHQQALVMFRKALDIFSELGASWWVARVLAEMGWSILEMGDVIGAGREWRESLRIANDIHAAPVALEALTGFASLQAKNGEPERGLELLLVILGHPASFPDTRKHATELAAGLETELTKEQIKTIRARAAATPLDARVEEHLNRA